MSNDLTQYISKIKVSSILDDDDQFQQSHLIDGRLETCWNSDEGDVQYVFFQFTKPLNLRRLELTFQGGFGAEHLQLQSAVSSSSGSGVDMEQAPADSDDDDENDENMLYLTTVAEFNSQDASSTQAFDFVAEGVNGIKITISRMADMFGRVILYDMKLYGDIAQ